MAAGAGALVLLLTALAVSPELHHGLLHDHHVEDDTCAVVLFANGVSLPLDPLTVTPPTAIWQTVIPPVASEIFLVPARYLLRPERGPPAC